MFNFYLFTYNKRKLYNHVTSAIIMQRCIIKSFLAITTVHRWNRVKIFDPGPYPTRPDPVSSPNDVKSRNVLTS